MKAVILAGGLGTRMAGHEGVPKPLLRVGPDALLRHVMRIYRSWGVTEFIVCVGHRSDEFARLFDLESFRSVRRSAQVTQFDLHGASGEGDYQVLVADTGENVRSGGRLRRIEQWLDGTFFMSYADGLADVDIPALLDVHRAASAEVTMTGVGLQVPYGVATVEGQSVTAFREKPTLPGLLTNIGFYVVEPSAVSGWCQSDVISWERDALPVIASAGTLAIHRHDGFWAAADYPHQHADLVRLWEESGAVWLPGAASGN
jgi:glucose-1-phosphate cytidylyltransferase